MSLSFTGNIYPFRKKILFSIKKAAAASVRDVKMLDRTR
jgi:hypothetical protein